MSGKASVFDVIVAFLLILLMGWVYYLKSHVDQLDFENHKQNYVIERIRPECIVPGVEQIRKVVR